MKVEIKGKVISTGSTKKGGSFANVLCSRPDGTGSDVVFLLTKKPVPVNTDIVAFANVRVQFAVEV
ncbi:MAG: hypothetical protein LLF28_02800 [Nitrospiraceae bacterium]|nr:hypothetical protein [Nitrospiraceae bacterium]